MRLLKLEPDGSYSTTEFSSNVPRYAILSHVWGPPLEEVLLQDLGPGVGYTKAGFRKLHFCQQQAQNDGLEYFWIDTCCIDKTNAVELSEAINCMFRWYQNAIECYVYLQDVSFNRDTDLTNPAWKSTFRKINEGNRLGDKFFLLDDIHEVTGVSREALQGDDLLKFGIIERFSWAARRRTTKKEDIVYSLLGLFGISMPLLYGEGKENAHRRLREEISKSSSDARKRAVDIDDRIYEAGPSTKKSKIENRSSRFTDEQITSLMESLTFEQLETRHRTIKLAHAKTCKWFLTSTAYLSWLDDVKLYEHHGFLWIKGKPGCGKSILMKYLFLNTKKRMKNNIFLSFFFNARGSDLEKSTIGAYRAILYQLLEQITSAHSVLHIIGSSASVGTSYNWEIETLKLLILEVVQKLDETSIVCLIDALDESEEEDIRDMISFLEGLYEEAATAGSQIRICLSSRYYPNITIRKGLSVDLDKEEGHSQDIQKYLQSELHIGRSKLAEEIRAELLQRASGVFMWVVLVINILNKEFETGKIHRLRKKLAEIPGDLHELFRSILARDSANRDELFLCLQWVLFARYPLGPRQLYLAILSGTKEGVPPFADLDSIELDDMERYILDVSKGMAEKTRSKTNPTIQFIHESVRDFLKDGGLIELQPVLFDHAEGHSHNRLKNCCDVYLNTIQLRHPESVADIGRTLGSTKTEQSQMREALGAKFPFLEYAQENLLYHAELAAKGGIVQKSFLQDFQIDRWAVLHNKFEKHEIRRYRPYESPVVPLFYVLAERDLSSLIDTLPLTDENLVAASLEESDGAGYQRYGPPFFAAMASGSASVVELILNKLRRVNENKVSHNSSGMATLYDGTEVMEILRSWPQALQDHTWQGVFSKTFAYSNKRSVHSQLAQYANADLFASIAGSGCCSVRSDHRDIRYVLESATDWGDMRLLKHLVQTIAEDHNLLIYVISVASEQASVGTLSIMIAEGTDIMYAGPDALPRALAKGHGKVVQFLLDNGVCVIPSLELRNAFLSAVTAGHQEVVGVIFKHHGFSGFLWEILGFIPLKSFEWLRTQGFVFDMQELLRSAGRAGNADLVRYLLTQHNDLNAQQTLNESASSGLLDVVTVILDTRRGIFYDDALLMAIESRHSEVVRMLIHKGLGPDTRDTLHKGSHVRKVVEMLIDGRYTEAKHLGDSLNIASLMGSYGLVELLLSFGGEMDKDRALRSSVFHGHRNVAVLLLDNGARPNEYGSFGKGTVILEGNAFDAARHWRDKDSVWWQDLLSSSMA